MEGVGGTLLMVIGVLMVTGVWLSLSSLLQRALSGSGWPPI